MTETTLSLLDSKRDLLNSLGSQLSSAQLAMSSNVDLANSLLASAIDTENQETILIGNLQKQMDSLTLQSSLSNIQQTNEDLKTKLASFTTLVQQNNASAAAVFDIVDQNTTLMNSVLSAISDVNSTVDNIKIAVNQIQTLIQTPPAPDAAVPAPVSTDPSTN